MVIADPLVFEKPFVIPRGKNAFIAADIYASDHSRVAGMANSYAPGAVIVSTRGAQIAARIDDGVFDSILSQQLYCTVDGQSGPTVTITDSELNVAINESTTVPYQELDTINCSLPSDHQITVENCILPSGGLDPNMGNNCDTDVVNFNVVAESDLSVEGVSVSGPASATVGSAFTVTATVTVGNAGPFGPINADVTATLTLPIADDCSTTDDNPKTVSDSIPLSPPDTDVDVTWSVTCTDKSDHSFSAEASVAVNQTYTLP